MKKIVLSLIIILNILCLAACGNDVGASKKGTKENPYTMNDTIIIESTAWEGNLYLGGKPIGTNKFELSNFRIEQGELDSYKDINEEVKVLVFDKKCIETCYDAGLNWLDTGNIFLDSMFNENMQTLEFSNIQGPYNDIDFSSIIYFEDTSYPDAYALCKLEDGYVYPSDENYHLARIKYIDKNLKEQYIFLQLD